MSTATLGGFLQHLKHTMAAESLADCSDGALVEQFLRTRDDATFTAMLRRHGPMVLRVCRRVLPRQHDAEDAFQATFLVLARRAGTVRKRASLASWLHLAKAQAAAGRKAEAKQTLEDALKLGNTLENPESIGGLREAALANYAGARAAIGDADGALKWAGEHAEPWVRVMARIRVIQAAANVLPE